MTNLKSKTRLDDVFTIRYGQKVYHNKENLDNGSTLLISSQATDNGCYGFYDIKPHFEPPVITVPSTGSIGWACVQLMPCGVADDALVLTPKEKYPTEYLFYVASAIRGMRWRFNYGRKIIPTRLGRLKVVSPKEYKTDVNYSKIFTNTFPKTTQKKAAPTSPYEFQGVLITELFDLERGQFHAINRLKSGTYPTVSRISTDNGLVDFFQKPRKAKIYPPGIITVSSVTGDAFMQLNPFIATDNVVMCIPKQKLMPTTLIYIQGAINSIKWRYSYGRQPYKRVFQKTIISLPYTKDGKVDEKYIKKMIEDNPYFDDFVTKVNTLSPGLIS